jgi:hypothetical protein
MCIDDKIKELEAEILKLKYQVKAQQSYLSMKSVPEWARLANERAIAAGVIPSPVGGSLDYYRIIKLFDTNGLL